MFAGTVLDEHVSRFYGPIYLYQFKTRLKILFDSHIYATLLYDVSKGDEMKFEPRIPAPHIQDSLGVIKPITSRSPLSLV